MSEYSDFFRSQVNVRHYVDTVYRPGDCDATIWDLQRSFLEKWLREFRASHKRVKGLDFACGTGRITSVAECYTDDMVGLDISAEMLEVAQERTCRTDLRLGDVLLNPEIIDYDYDLITAFRFFLNAEADMRVRIMQSLSSRLRDDQSRLIFNIHGNRDSLRHLTMRMRRRSGTWRNEMSLDEVRRLTDLAGLEIEAYHGFGVLPRFLYRTPMNWVAWRFDHSAAAVGLLSRVSCDLLFICRRRSPDAANS